ncbi:hypothetical protein C8P63_1191 [Melghirimyces profundicolus]|uniref:Golvesin/Xly CBD-like domain-containing protein n=1 Tax=Melghirimyces profundicolus TaxID=1242148 RepID=A0A2T6BGV7_9BACL|nr:hypothetical protein [Melghirimyces profundicolus]PTX55294.1 hypothetical protein C8P63_1191 [Melghirimyces profundicolus]
MKRLLKLVFPVVFLGTVLFVMIGFRHLETLDAQELRVIEEFRKRMKLEAQGGALDEGRKQTVGEWPLSVNAHGYFGPDYQTHPAGDGSGIFTWTFRVKQAGNYQIFVNYASAPDRASNAPYTVYYHGGQSKTVIVNQKTGGGQWVSLGTFPFQKGDQGKVVLTNRADGFVIADAVKIVGTQNTWARLILDNRNALKTASGSGGR